MRIRGRARGPVFCTVLEFDPHGTEIEQFTVTLNQAQDFLIELERLTSELISSEGRTTHWRLHDGRLWAVIMNSSED